MVEELFKVEKTCTVTSVDGNTPQNGWQCKCYDQGGGVTTHSYKGPGFSSWVAGSQGCPGTQGAHLVVRPDTGENFCVISTCT